MPASAETFRALGSVTSPAQYVGDSAGTTYRVAVHNSNATLSIGAVSVRAPSGWRIVSCPAGPVGWSRTLVAGQCRYVSAPGAAGDIRPRAVSSSFRAKATTRSSSSDLTGRWTVLAYRASAFSGSPATASPGASSMVTRAYSLQVRRVLVADAPAAGTVCPAAATSAVAGTRRTLVVCVVNRSTAALTPVYNHSRLGGSFASGGSFRSSATAAGPSRSFLASWRDVLVGAPGGGRTTSVRLGTSDGRQSSPTTTFTGYTSSAPPTVTGNRAPSATDDNGAVSADSAVRIPVLVNDSDADGDALHVASVDTAGTVGAVAVNTDGSISYDAHGRFGSLAPGASATDTFRYRAGDATTASAAAVVTVTVTAPSGATPSPSPSSAPPAPPAPPAPLTQRPTVVTDSGSAAYTENAAPTVVSPGITVTDPDSATLEGATVMIGSGFVAGQDVLGYVNSAAITGTYDAPTGVLTLTGSASVADYQAALRTVTFDTGGDNPATANRTVSFRASDSEGGSPTASRDVIVTPVNDAAAVTMTNTALSFSEGDVAKAVDSGLLLTDPDSGIMGATVSITGGFAPAEDSLGFVDTLTFFHTYDPATGVLTLTGSDTVAAYQAALRSVGYANGSDNPITTTRTVSVQVTDSSAAASNTATRDITVTAVNDAPTATDQSVSTNEDTALPVTVSGTDPENDSLSFTFDASSAQGGTVSGLAPSLTYTPPADYCGPDSFGFTADDGNGGTDTGTISITVSCVDDAPSIDLNGPAAGTGTAPTFSEQASHTGGAVTLAPNGTITDVDDTNLDSLTVTLTNHPDNSAEELLADTAGTLITAVPYDSNTGVLALHGQDTLAHYQQVLRTVAYVNSAAPPDAATRSVYAVANDGDADSNTAIASVSIVPLNAAPVVDLNGAGTPGFGVTAAFTEDAGPATLAPAADVSDADNASLASATVTLTNRPDGPAESISATVSGTAITSDAYVPATGMLFLHGSDTVANYQTVIRSLG
jgi:VCBS repeat-containing protein